MRPTRLRTHVERPFVSKLGRMASSALTVTLRGVGRRASCSMLEVYSLLGVEEEIRFERQSDRPKKV